MRVRGCKQQGFSGSAFAEGFGRGPLGTVLESLSHIQIQAMKKLHSIASEQRARKAACTISAAALMLGVSQAATVGFNFQCNYCSAASYAGAVVTAPAFGIPPEGWENLSQMDTGYGCTADYFTLNELIDAQSSTGGLNPLPSGALAVAWSAYTANVSGFGGYSRSGPHYTFGGNGYKPGNEQVYWGFLRDGVNFGPGSSGGDNNQPGYAIDLTGLGSVFTNGAYVVQLIASADSMQYLTNAFIIDATGNTTQSVVYPSTPPVKDVGDTSWVRGIGGGLSTVSGPLSADHLKILGNQAAHAGDKITGYNWASTICGFIITDKPVVSMSPNSVLAFPGDTNIVLSAAAAGVPPLAYQWRKEAQPLPGATNSSLAFDRTALSIAGHYDLVVTNRFGLATSAVATLAVDVISAVPGTNFIVDSNPNATSHDGTEQGAAWVASSTDSVGVARSGVMRFTATNSSQIVVAGQTNFDTPTGTIMFWMRSAGVADTTTNTPALLFGRSASDGLVIIQNQDGTLQFEPAAGAGFAIAGMNVSDNKWHHIAATFDQAMAKIGLYIDGVSAGTTDLSAMATPWAWESRQPIELGSSAGKAQPSQPYEGLLDDVRFYSQVLSGADIAAAYQSDALGQPSALLLRLNFDAPPVNGATLRWLCPDVILQSADSAAGPYSDLPAAFSPYSAAAAHAMKFYRYYGHTPASVISNPYMM